MEIRQFFLKKSNYLIVLLIFSLFILVFELLFKNAEFTAKFFSFLIILIIVIALIFDFLRIRKNKIEGNLEKTRKNFTVATFISMIVVLVVGYYLNYITDRQITAICENNCCQYVEFQEGWINKCNLEFIAEQNTNEFSSKELCIENCFSNTNFIKPKMPKWLQILSSIF